MLDKLKSSLQLENTLRELRGPNRTQHIDEIIALGSQRDPSAFDMLLELLRDQFPAVREAAAKALGTGGSGKAAEPLLKACLDKDVRVRTAAGQALSELVAGDQPLAPVIRALEDQGAFMRAVAARTLGKWGRREAIPALINAVCDREGEVRKVVVKALKRLGEQQWLMWVDGGPHDFTRLANGHDPRALPPLLKALDDPLWRVRAAVARGLAKYDDDVVLPALLKHLKDEHGEVRAAAAETLGLLGDRRAMESLLYLLDDKEPGVRDAAAKALDRIDVAQQHKTQE
jgi:HEAT repeat protein